MNPHFGFRQPTGWDKYNPTGFLNGLSQQLNLGNITTEPGHARGRMSLFHPDGTPKGSLAIEMFGEDTTHFSYKKDGRVKPPGFFHKAKKSIMDGLGLGNRG